jgi:hypothetical protein
MPPHHFRDILKNDTNTPHQLLEVITDCYFHIHGGNDMSLQMIIQQVTKLGIDTNKPSKEKLEVLIQELDKVSESFATPRKLSRSKHQLACFVNICTPTT